MSNAEPRIPLGRAPSSRRPPMTLWLGAAIILACEILLFTDVHRSGRSAIHTAQQFADLPVPHGGLARLARWVAVNMTALVWPGYVLLLEGICVWRGASPVRARPNHFAMLALASILIWCLFDWINFYFISSWRYLGMPPRLIDRAWGYVLAFAAIVPGMLLTGQVLLEWRCFDAARSRPWPMPKILPALVFIIGVAMFAWPFVARNPIANLTLWTSLVFMLDPLNYALGRPSMLRDWSNGWYGRSLAAFAGGLGCGLLWEFWNYWALAKWTYHLPFLGALEHVRYFEMPVIGLLGFIPFGLECWIMWQTVRILLDGLVEPLPDERWLI